MKEEMKILKLGTIKKKGLEINVFWTGKEMRLGYNGIVEKTIISKNDNAFVFMFGMRMKAITGAAGIGNNEIGEIAHKIYQDYSVNHGWFAGIEV